MLGEDEDAGEDDPPPAKKQGPTSVGSFAFAAERSRELVVEIDDLRDAIDQKAKELASIWRDADTGFLFD